ncbi:MAG: hypothetical protein ACQCXQ_09300 [Verrucomicrobiales bacterium]
MTQRLCAVAVVGLVPLTLTGCGNTEDKEQIEKLDEEISSLEKKLSASDKDRKDLQEDFKKSESALDKANDEVRDLKRRAESAERELERYKQREEKALAEQSRKKPSKKELEAQAKALIDAHMGGMVEIKGDESSVHGLVVAADDKKWIYTAASGISGNSKLEITKPGGGKLLKFGAFEIAEGSDLARLEIKEEVDPALVIAEPSDLESRLSVYGLDDSEELIEARVYGGEAESLKVGTKLTQGPKGGPVFHGETGDLLGIVVDGMTTERPLWKESETLRSRSRSGSSLIVCRLDREITWTAMSIGSFLEEGKAIAAADEMTRLIHACVAVAPDRTGVNFDGEIEGSDMKASDILNQYSKSTSVRPLYGLDKWLKVRGNRASQVDMSRKISGAFSMIVSTAKKDTKEFGEKNFSSFHRSSAAQSLEWRKEAQKKLADYLGTL